MIMKQLIMIFISAILAGSCLTDPEVTQEYSQDNNGGITNPLEGEYLGTSGDGSGRACHDTALIKHVIINGKLTNVPVPVLCKEQVFDQGDPSPETEQDQNTVELFMNKQNQMIK